MVQMIQTPQTQIQISKEIRNKIEEIIENIKEFLKENNIRININYELWKDIHGGIYFWIDLGKLEFSENEFNDFIELIKDLGFYNSNGAENQIVDYIGFKEYQIFEEFRHFSKDIVIYLNYNKALISNKEFKELIYYLNILAIAINTTKNYNKE